jgi:hypothetical protein
MMNEIDEAALAALIAQHGIGDVLLALARHCAKQGEKTAMRIRRAEWELCAHNCQDAAEIAAHAEYDRCPTV